MEKKIAVLLATHNSERYLRVLLDSVVNQTYKNIQIVVSDDGSTDSTAEILKEYPQITVLNSGKPLKSAKNNFMFLIKNAPQADYYMFCDHDDKWCENKIGLTLDMMEKTERNGRPCLVHTDLAVVDEKLDMISASMFDRQKLDRVQDLAHTLVQNNVTGCTCMINEPLRLIASRVSDNGDIIMHDWLLAVLASAFGDIGFVDKPTILYRQHSGNEVGAKNAGSLSYIIGKMFDKNNKESLIKTYRQARCILDSFGDSLGENKDIIEKYASFLQIGKIKKLKLMKKYGFYKNTGLRRIGQLIYM